MAQNIYEREMLETVAEATDIFEQLFSSPDHENRPYKNAEAIRDVAKASKGLERNLRNGQAKAVQQKLKGLLKLTSNQSLFRGEGLDRVPQIVKAMAETVELYEHSTYMLETLLKYADGNRKKARSEGIPEYDLLAEACEEAAETMLRKGFAAAGTFFKRALENKAFEEQGVEMMYERNILPMFTQQEDTIRRKYR